MKVLKLRAMPYAEYLTTPHWRKKRRDAIRHYGEKCNRCGGTDGIQVHHRSYKRRGEERMEDLEVLCEGCHENEHEGDKPWICDPMTREYLAIMASCP